MAKCKRQMLIDYLKVNNIVDVNDTVDVNDYNPDLVKRFKVQILNGIID